MARAWRAEGRTGEDAAALIVARISPGLLSAHRERGFDEGAALGWTAVPRTEGLEAVQQALGWTQLGLSPQDVGHSRTQRGDIGATRTVMTAATMRRPSRSDGSWPRPTGS